MNWKLKPSNDASKTEISNPFSEQYLKYERIGITEIHECAFVIVATSEALLGNSTPNLFLRSNTLTSNCYLKLFCEQIKAIQYRYAQRETLSVSKSATQVRRSPVAIVTCHHTRELLEDLLVSKDFFGLHATQVTLLSVDEPNPTQEKESKIENSDASSSSIPIHISKIILDEVHNVVNKSLTARKWLQNGFKWIYFFHELHALSLHVLPVLLGISVEKQFLTNYLCTSRKMNHPSSQIYAILYDENVNTENNSEFPNEIQLQEMPVCVDYSTLQYLIRNSRADIDHGIENECSLYHGCSSNLLVQLDCYCAAYDRKLSFGERDVSGKGENSGNDTRFVSEFWYNMLPCFSMRFGVTVVDHWMFFFPESSLISQSSSLSYCSPFTQSFLSRADAAQFYYTTELLKAMGAQIQYASDIPEYLLSFGGAIAPSFEDAYHDSHMPLVSSIPKIVFDSTFAIFPCEIRNKFASPINVSLSQQASLIVYGNVIVESLQLHGALKLMTKLDGSKLIVRCDKNDAIWNDGYTLRSPCKGSEMNEETLFRGYTIHKIAEEVVVAEGGLELFYTGAHTTRITSTTTCDHHHNSRFDGIQGSWRDDENITLSCEENDTCGGCILDLCFYMLLLRR